MTPSLLSSCEIQACKIGFLLTLVLVLKQISPYFVLEANIPPIEGNSTKKVLDHQQRNQDGGSSKG